MKILMVFHFAPAPPNFGAAIRMYHQLLETCKRHEVHVISLGDREEKRVLLEHIGNRCKRVIFIERRRAKVIRFLIAAMRISTLKSSYFRVYVSRKLEKTIKRMSREESYDLIFFSTAFFGFNDLPADAPIIGDTHNIEYDNLHRAARETKDIFRKIYYSLEWRTGKREETTVWQNFDAVLATSERDADLIRQHAREKPVHVIPNGVDLEYFAPTGMALIPRTLVFTGLMNYYPNNHAVLYFLDEIFPLILEKAPDAVFYVVGANPSNDIRARASKNVVITGYVDDVRPYVARSMVTVIPIQIGGGTRLKALESMAMKRPIVSTTIGCEGLHANHEESVLLADTPQDFANAVLRIFEDGDLACRLTEEAYRRVCDGYGWNAIGLKLEEVYQSLKNHQRQSVS